MIGRTFKSEHLIGREIGKKPKRFWTITIFALLVLLALVNLTIFYQLQKKNDQNVKMRETIKGVTATINKIDDALRNSDYQRVFRHLNEAKRQLAALSPPGPKAVPSSSAPSVAPPAVAHSKPAESPPIQERVTTPASAAVTIVPPPDGYPKAFVLAEEGENLLVCEKESKTLYWYRSQAEKFTLVKSYPCVIGANNHEKMREGDLATPVGIYFTVRFTPGTSLPDTYGYGAFVLNYPNYLDRKAGKKGGGIWIHGHSPGKTLGTDIPDTKGCIV
ncbi:MAG: L,D-transpeptidase family protein, partial [Syntrophales bacterium]|nr:L,D-transpeptidase family protein [Syntrophales bacterium]